MLNILRIVLCLALTTAAFETAAFAQSAAGGQLDSLKQAKVLAHIARARARGGVAPGARGPGAECDIGALEIGNVNVARGALVPREVMVVIEGDVINVNGQVARPGC